MCYISAVATNSSYLAEKRQREILKQATTENVVRINDLAQRLDVHQMTIRRDLDALAEEGLLERLHGGARIAQQASAEISYQLRVNEQVEIKERLARAALELISDGDTVALDPSTTCLALARVLVAREVTVVSNCLEVANVLAGTDTRHILIGGNFHRKSRAYVGTLTVPPLARLHYDVMFFSAKGFTARSGFTDAYLPEVEIKERMIDAATLSVALLDHSKFGHEALGTIAHPSRVNILITDKELEGDFQQVLEKAGTRIVVAP